MAPDFSTTLRSIKRWTRYVATPPATPAGVEKLTPEPKTGVHYDTSWSRKPTAKALRTLGIYGFFKPAIRLYGDPQVIGSENLDDLDEPVIFASNHLSHADTSLLLATIPRKLRRDLTVAAGADYFFPNRFTSTASALFIGAIPIERKRISRLSIDNAFEALSEGQNLLIYPEGGRSPDGMPRPHRPGAAFIAKKAGAKVVPTYVHGTREILPKGSNWPQRSQCAVLFGSVLTVGDDDSRAFAERIEEAVEQLRVQYHDGWWASKKPAADKVDELAGWRRRWVYQSSVARSRQDSAKEREHRWPR